MAALDDPRAIERLRSLLHDGEAEVRDAAFTALAKIHQGEPLLAAEAGLDATHEDVRRRGLQALVAEARRAPGVESTTRLLARALNDSSAGVRSEAFKSVLSLRVGGGGAAGTLRFAARSVHADVRREVLTEVMAQVGEPWGLDLLLEFFNDPDPSLRDEAFAFALKKTKGVEFLDAALGSRHADLRMKAVEGLIKKHTAPAQALLVRALDDEDKAVRRAALASLVDADALPTLAGALGNAHPDVRLRAAKALARHGDPRALAPLLALATAPEPEEKERRADWLQLAESALDGLGELGDPAALPHLIPPLDSPHGALRKEAALALARVSPVDRLDPLRLALRHADPEVKYRAAFGLACLGDASVASLVFSDAGAQVISVGGQVAAALALGDPGEGRLVVFLDDPKAEVRSRALLLLMIREWKAPRGTADRALSCLSSRTPRLRLTAARAIEALADPAGFARFVADLVNDRGDKPDWKVPEAVIDALAEMLAHGDHNLQVRTAEVDDPRAVLPDAQEDRPAGREPERDRVPAAPEMDDDRALDRREGPGLPERRGGPRSRGCRPPHRRPASRSAPRGTGPGKAPRGPGRSRRRADKTRRGPPRRSRSGSRNGPPRRRRGGRGGRGRTARRTGPRASATTSRGSKPPTSRGTGPTWTPPAPG